VAEGVLAVVAPGGAAEGALPVVAPGGAPGEADGGGLVVPPGGVAPLGGHEPEPAPGPAGHEGFFLPCFFFGGQFDPGPVVVVPVVGPVVDADVVVVVLFLLGLVVDVVPDDPVAAVDRPGWCTAGWVT
jgi:hypothetical protein